MLTTIIIVAVILTIIAIIILFAMVGQLVAEVRGSKNSSSGNEDLELIPGARIGKSVLPASSDEINRLREEKQSYLVVFSSACSTCNQIAAETSEVLRRVADHAAIIVSTGEMERGNEFIRRTGIDKSVPCSVDERGKWTTASLGITLSPSIVELEGGVVKAAYAFNAPGGVRKVIEGRVTSA